MRVHDWLLASRTHPRLELAFRFANDTLQLGGRDCASVQECEALPADGSICTDAATCRHNTSITRCAGAWVAGERFDHHELHGTEHCGTSERGIDSDWKFAVVLTPSHTQRRTFDDGGRGG